MPSTISLRGVDDLRVGDHVQFLWRFFIFFRAKFHYDHAFRNRDLGGCQPHARGFAHGFHHVIHQLLKFLAELSHLAGFASQDGVWEGNYFA